MRIHPDFPKSPYEIIDPSLRRYPPPPAKPPPLVPDIRQEVKEWRDNAYGGASDTSKALLNWWFNTPEREFQYYFAQREAIETIIYLYDVVKVRQKFDLMQFDNQNQINERDFHEHWCRFVVKMATGTGKTKVLSLAIAWSFFHKLYESDSELSRNFLMIAPNIIVLERLYYDFQELRIFRDDPVVPENGYFNGRNWRRDFKLTLHKQDNVHVRPPVGNIFLTNIQRVYTNESPPPSVEDDNTMDYFLGKEPKGELTQSKVDLGGIVRDIDELMVLNDEAHHVHARHLAWFKSIEDIQNTLLQKGRNLSLQVDVTATPRDQNGRIFVQTVSDYTLLEAITQKVVKQPVIPDTDSRDQLVERPSVKYTERYADYIHLGVIEWRNRLAYHEKLGKKPILFVMTDDTKNCDELKDYLENRYTELKGEILVIHTKQNGEIREGTSGRPNKELNELRKQANEIDSGESPYKVIVSVLMLKEGWDVKNVTTIVGLRAYSATSNILPEQTLGRGLRRMYTDELEERVSVIGTDHFLDFVESMVTEEGEVLEYEPIRPCPDPLFLIIEIDRDNPNKNLDALDIEIPMLASRINREYTHLHELDISEIQFSPAIYFEFSESERKDLDINFIRAATGRHSHTTQFDRTVDIDYQSEINRIVGHLAMELINSMRLVTGYDLLYSKIQDFVARYLFGRDVALDSPSTFHNLRDDFNKSIILQSFRQAINDLTIQDSEVPPIVDGIKLQHTQPFRVKDEFDFTPSKSLFNRITGANMLEMNFALFLEDCVEVVAFVKNYVENRTACFSVDYVNTSGKICHYFPDIVATLSDGRIVIVETKGRVDEDVPLKMRRLALWCEDINHVQQDITFDFVYVPQVQFDSFRTQPNRTFERLLARFREYK